MESQVGEMTCNVDKEGGNGEGPRVLCLGCHNLSLRTVLRARQADKQILGLSHEWVVKRWKP